MELFKLKIVRILMKLEYSIYKQILFMKFQTKEELIIYILGHLKREEASLFYYYFSKAFPDEFVQILMPHFSFVLKHIDFQAHFIYHVAMKYGENVVLEHLDEISFHLKMNQYIEAMHELYNSNEELKSMIRNLSPTVFQFYDALLVSNNYYHIQFLYNIIYPMSQTNIDEYLKTMNQKLFGDKPLEIEFIDRGNSNFVFDVNGTIIKLGDNRHRFPILMHYRMNDFFVRRKFELKKGSIFIEASPKGNVKAVTEKDIEDSVLELKESGIVITDLNYPRNFALFEEEPMIHFQDVEGIIETRNSPYSKSYQKRKVKLIDHDYIYDTKESEKYWVENRE